MASIDRAGHDERGPACRRAGLFGLRLLAVLLATAVLGAWGQASPVAAEQVDPRAGEWGVDAVLGVGGQVVGDTWTPVTVTLHPEQPFRGRVLLMSTRAGTTTLQTRAVEVPAGVQKRYLLLAPPGLDLQVQVVEDGTEEVVTLQPRAEQASGFLVGVLGGSDPTALPPVTLPMTDQRARPVAVDAALLELGPRALQSLSTLVVRQSDLADLSETARRAVAARVAEGATLVVTGATDPDLGLPWRAFTDRTDAGLSPLPGAWAAQAPALDDPAGQRSPSHGDAPADVVAIAAGRGRLVATTLEVGGPGPASDQVVWEDLLQPDPQAVTSSSSRRFDDLPLDIERAFGDSAGEPPSFAWLAVFFVVYVVVAGPVLGMVLSRRRRPEMAWVVVPVVTALFAGAAFVGASGARPRVGVGARVATWVDGVGTTMAVAGVRAPQAGQHTITLPGTGWDVSTAGRSAVRLAEGADTVATVQVRSQSLGAVVGWRSLDQEPPLDVEVALFDTEARVEVTNTSGQDLGAPTVRLATERHELAATLAAGDTLVDTIPLPDALSRQRDPFNEGIRGPFDMPSSGPEDLAVLARWQLLDRSPGMAIVTATSEGDLGLGSASVDGTAPTELGTLVAVGVTPSVTDDATTPFEVRRDLVATGRGAHHDLPLTLSGPGPATMRFRLPHEGAVESLSLALEHDMGRFGQVEPMPPPPEPVERCGLLERRNQAGDVLEATDVCAPDFPCPPDAQTCSWSHDGGDRAEGEACFGDGTCQELVWTIDDGPLQPQPPGPAPPELSGMQVWNHLDRRWVDVPADQDVADDEGATRWLSPLGEVWVRATGEMMPFDLAPQGVAAALGGSR